MGNVLITNVTQYAGPGTLPVLLREKMHAFCHDASFEDKDAALSFESAHPGATQEDLWGQPRDMSAASAGFQNRPLLLP